MFPNSCLTFSSKCRNISSCSISLPTVDTIRAFHFSYYTQHEAKLHCGFNLHLCYEHLGMCYLFLFYICFMLCMFVLYKNMFLRLFVFCFICLFYIKTYLVFLSSKPSFKVLDLFLFNWLNNLLIYSQCASTAFQYLTGSRKKVILCESPDHIIPQLKLMMLKSKTDNKH